MSEKRWFTLPNGRQVYRAVPKSHVTARSDLPMPYISSDTLDEPLRSGADGELYTSKSALRASYRAKNNPRGIEFTEVGNEEIPVSTEWKRSDDKGVEQSIKKAASRLGVSI